MTVMARSSGTKSSQKAFGTKYCLVLMFNIETCSHTS